MRFRHLLWVLWAAAHLVLVICGACQTLPESSTNPLAQPVRWYGGLSGANSHYGFYAPEVGDEYRATFILRDFEGSSWRDTFMENKSPEARLRLGGSVEAGFANGAAEASPAARKRIVMSWAASMFTRHPSAVSLDALVEAHYIPTMAEYRAGLRPEWKVVYHAQVERDPIGAPCGEPALNERDAPTTARSAP